MEKNRARELIDFARKSIISYFDGNPIDVSDEGEEIMVFVTLKKKDMLRGCIGFMKPLPVMIAVFDAARAAAFSDYRFPPLKKEEIKDLNIELSILTKPEIMRSLDDIIIGRTGIIVEKGSKSGLLLPQVASEQGWSKEEFLEHTSIKAGMDANAWKDSKVLLFHSEVFAEKSPEGEVEQLL